MKSRTVADDCKQLHLALDHQTPATRQDGDNQSWSACSKQRFASTGSLILSARPSSSGRSARRGASFAESAGRGGEGGTDGDGVGSLLERSFA